MAPATMKYENAGLNIQVLFNELTKAGLIDDARRLSGIEVTSQQTALGAIEVVKNLRLRNGHTPKEVLASRNWTLTRLNEAVLA